MSELALKSGFAYLNRKGGRVLMDYGLYKDGSSASLEFIDKTGITYLPNGKVTILPEEYDLVEELFECHGLDTPESIFFYEQDYYCFSNFSSFAIEWKGIRFDTLEHAYHYEKFDSYQYFRDDTEKSKTIATLRGQIRRASSAHEAFKLGQLHRDLRRPDWDEDEGKVRTMFMLLIEKVKQHPYVEHKLRSTHGRRMTENSWRDNWWGIGADGKGLDVLGQLWQAVRRLVEGGYLHQVEPETFPLKVTTKFPEPPKVIECDNGTKLTFEFGIHPYSRDDRHHSLLSSKPESAMIKVPLPAGMEDTPELRQKMTEFLLATQKYSNQVLSKVIQDYLGRSGVTFEQSLPKPEDRTGYVDVGRFPVGSGD